MDPESFSDVNQTSPDKFLNALAENYLLQDAILNATDLTVISTKKDGTISTINKAGEPMLGYGAEELIGIHKLSVFHEEAELRDLLSKLKDASRQPPPMKHCSQGPNTGSPINMNGATGAKTVPFFRQRFR